MFAFTVTAVFIFFALSFWVEKSFKSFIDAKSFRCKKFLSLSELFSWNMKRRNGKFIFLSTSLFFSLFRFTLIFVDHFLLIIFRLLGWKFLHFLITRWFRVFYCDFLFHFFMQFIFGDFSIQIFYLIVSWFSAFIGNFRFAVKAQSENSAKRYYYRKELKSYQREKKN